MTSHCSIATEDEKSEDGKTGEVPKEKSGKVTYF